MNSPISHDHWQFALLDDDWNKADQLGAQIVSLVVHFSDVLSFMTSLSSITTAPNCLNLIVSLNLSRDLPSDIGQKVRRLFIYDTHSNNNFPSFSDICGTLVCLLIAQSTALSFRFYHLNEHAPARYWADYATTLMKIVEQDLQEMCDNLNENTRLGEEANDQ